MVTLKDTGVTRGSGHLFFSPGYNRVMMVISTGIHYITKL